MGGIGEVTGKGGGKDIPGQGSHVGFSLIVG